MMAIVEAACRKTAPERVRRHDSRRRDGQAKNHTMETDTPLGALPRLSSLPHPPSSPTRKPTYTTA